MAELSPDPQAHVEQLLRDSPVCASIFHFLSEHANAMDTVEGIAACWAECDPLAAQSALDLLLAHGLLETRNCGSRTFYALTREPALRAIVLDRVTDAGPCATGMAGS
jgi:hypothetical protein